MLVASVVCELQLNAVVSGAQLAHDLLENVAVLGNDADGVALDAGLRLELGVLDGRDNLFGGI